MAATWRLWELAVPAMTRRSRAAAITPSVAAGTRSVYQKRKAVMHPLRARGGGGGGDGLLDGAAKQHATGMTENHLPINLCCGLRLSAKCVATADGPGASHSNAICAVPIGLRCRPGPQAGPVREASREGCAR